MISPNESVSIQNIRRALPRYVNQRDTAHAIAVDGEWGVGKTRFINDVFASDLIDTPLISISMYGVKTVDDIESAIFQEMSRFGAFTGKHAAKMLNSMSASVDGVRVGGAGVLVHAGLKLMKSRALSKLPEVVICFDDCERFSGDLNVLFGYVNNLVECAAVKCLLIGDFSKLDGDQTVAYQKARTKVVRYVYPFSHSPQGLIRISLENASIEEKFVDRFISDLFLSDEQLALEVLQDTDCANIRLLTDVIRLFAEVVEGNLEKFKLSALRAMSFFTVLLAVSRLVQLRAGDEPFLQKLGRVEYAVLHDSRVEFLGKGVAGEGSDYSAKEKALLRMVLYAPDDIPISLVIKLAYVGFYLSEDFEGVFDEWREATPVEEYLDAFGFLSMEDEEAKKVFAEVKRLVFDEKSVTGPGVLLQLVDRISKDIKRGVLDLDFDTTKEQFRNIFDELYKTRSM